MNGSPTSGVLRESGLDLVLKLLRRTPYCRTELQCHGQAGAYPMRFTWNSGQSTKSMEQDMMVYLTMLFDMFHHVHLGLPLHKELRYGYAPWFFVAATSVFMDAR